MKEQEFEKFVQNTIDSLPVEFKEIMQNVDIFVADLPTREQMHKMMNRGVRGILLGLYEGVPQTKRGYRYGIGGNLPDRITIFRLPILRVSRTWEEARARIEETVLHEIGHHFGMSEQEIADAMHRRT